MSIVKNDAKNLYSGPSISFFEFPKIMNCVYPNIIYVPDTFNGDVFDYMKMCLTNIHIDMYSIKTPIKTGNVMSIHYKTNSREDFLFKYMYMYISILQSSNHIGTHFNQFSSIQQITHTTNESHICELFISSILYDNNYKYELKVIPYSIYMHEHNDDSGTTWFDVSITFAVKYGIVCHQKSEDDCADHKSSATPADVLNAMSKEDMYMNMSHLVAMRSKDPNTKVGAVIVGEDDRIRSLGYNGFPNAENNDVSFPWDRESKQTEEEKKTDLPDTKYAYVVHAELNAILNYRGGSLVGSTLYVSLFPCNECAKSIIQSGIKKVIYEDDKYADTPGVKASKKMFDVAGVEYKQYKRIKYIKVE